MVRRTRSTRRLWARPSSVSLVSAGEVSEPAIANDPEAPDIGHAVTPAWRCSALRRGSSCCEIADCGWAGNRYSTPAGRGLVVTAPTSAILLTIGRLAGAMMSSPEAKNVASRLLITRPRGSSVNSSFPPAISGPRPCCSVVSDLARSGGWPSGGGGGSDSVETDIGPGLGRLTPGAANTVEIAEESCPCSRASRTDSETVGFVLVRLRRGEHDYKECDRRGMKFA